MRVGLPRLGGSPRWRTGPITQASQVHWLPWGQLHKAVRTGQPMTRRVLGAEGWVKNVLHDWDEEVARLQRELAETGQPPPAPVPPTLEGTKMSTAVDAERYSWCNGAALTATCMNGSGSQVLATVTPPRSSFSGRTAHALVRSASRRKNPPARNWELT
ncbi:hypothetical protein [Stigmatella erecta]|uniref:Uncharacterized protein n=1 Tax=Stigmatella erecta TaxID=83460 RepID=A0A1I0FMN7_9BACT|nr:hypothetical protein [Stigmatella erecta]SET59586.1 hypothetical protein SAMN05443639_103479 [Stigmatella erecta]